MPVEMIISDAATLAETGFYWRERNGVKILVCKPLEDAGFINGFSTRVGGVSTIRDTGELSLAGFEEDSAGNINENRRRFLETLGSDFKLATAWQVHGDGVKTVRTNEDVERSEEKFDSLVSQLPGVLIGVKTADCVPVLIGDTKTNAFAAVHAGWRGTVQSIVVRAIEKMQSEFGSDPEDLMAAIGPAASGKNYEIGQDVVEAFGNAFDGSEKYFAPTTEGHALVDLHLANKDQLLSCGVPFDAIYTAPFCTIERTDLFFSYRVEKKLFGRTGRLLSVIGRR